MPDKIPSDIRALALSLHTDLTTLNTYADNATMVAALAPLIRGKLVTIRAAVDDIAGVPAVAYGAYRPVLDKPEADNCPTRELPE